MGKKDAGIKNGVIRYLLLISAGYNVAAETVVGGMTVIIGMIIITASKNERSFFAFHCAFPFNDLIYFYNFII